MPLKKNKKLCKSFQKSLSNVALRKLFLGGQNMLLNPLFSSLVPNFCDFHPLTFEVYK
jgi:hypothetical protein